jgi:hypothetical protein
MLNHTPIRTRDTQHKSTVVDECIIDEDARRHRLGHIDRSPMAALDSPLLARPPYLALMFVVGHRRSTRSSCVPSMVPTRSFPAGTTRLPQAGCNWPRFHAGSRTWTMMKPSCSRSYAKPRGSSTAEARHPCAAGDGERRQRPGSEGRHPGLC